MKRNLLLVASLFAGFFASAQDVDANGYTTVNVPMEAGYAKQVYYSLGTNTQTPASASSWDLGFQKAASAQSLGAIRVNDYKITAMYEVSSDLTQWADINVTTQTGWTQLYNSPKTWSIGAFDTASDNAEPFGFGWGSYDMGTHHVNGTRIFVLQYGSSNPTYKKIIIEKLNTTAAGGPTMTIKYSSWTAGAWSADQEATFPYSENAGTNFIYYSLDTNATVTVAPADTAWDFVFSKYYDLTPTGNGDVMYNVTGALTNNASVAAVNEAGTSTTFTLPAANAYTTDINGIGDKWKVFDMTNMVYTIPEKTYYVKTADNKIYRMYFLSFAGSSTGALSFKFKDVTPTAGVDEFTKSTFSIYPNPSTDRNITINHNLESKGTVNVFTLTGANVFSGELNNSGSQNLNLSTLSAGMYIVKIESGSYSESKKLIIQ